MSWKNDDTGSNDPWNGRDVHPPDLEQLFQDIRNRFGQRHNPFSSHSSGGGPGQRKSVLMFLMVCLLLWMATGIYVVKPYEQGVVVRFGRWVETTGAGPHFHLPYPIETVYKPNVTQVQSVEIGYRTRDDRAMVDVPAESLMLTGDENIIDIDLVVQYIVKDGAAYLFNVRDPSTNPQQVVRNASESAIRMVVGRNNIDEALTSGKDKIQQLTKEMISQILADYNSGILITAVQMQQVSPPKEVVHAFKDVASAREDRVRAINEAQGYSSDILPRAKGDSARLIQEAEAYKATRVARAEGDGKRFLALLQEYQKARDITRSRLYIETMENVLATTRKVVVDPRAGASMLPYMPMNLESAVGGGAAKSGHTSSRKTTDIVPSVSSSGGTP